MQKQLKDGPLTLIKSVDLNSQNYEAAKELLIEAFASPVTQQFNAIKRLINLKFVAGDDPYKYISNMRQVIEAFKTLKIDTDLVLQFFIWSGLNIEMKTNLMQITNHNKPTLKEIQESIFITSERYTQFNKKSKTVVHKGEEDCPSVDQNCYAAAVNPGKNVKK